MLRDRVVFVRVALGAGHRRPHPRGHRRVDAVDDRGVAELLVVRASLAVRHRVPMKRGRDELVLGRIRQQVARYLLDRELVERLVRVERPDHIVAKCPDRPRRVIRVAGRIGIPRQVQPLPRPVLAVCRGRQQLVDQPLVCLRLLVIHKCLNHIRRRRQAGQVKRHAAREREAIGLRLGRQTFAIQAIEHERIHRMHAVARWRRLHRFFVCPMARIAATLRDPPLQQRDLLGGQPLARTRRRHQIIPVVRGHARDQVAQVGQARNDRPLSPAQIDPRSFFRIEPQSAAPRWPALALLLIRPVAHETVVRQDRPDVVGKGNRRLFTGRRHHPRQAESHNPSSRPPASLRRAARQIDTCRWDTHEKQFGVRKSEGAPTRPGARHARLHRMRLMPYHTPHNLPL